jgi:hypothetical protein
MGIKQFYFVHYLVHLRCLPACNVGADGASALPPLHLIRLKHYFGHAAPALIHFGANNFALCCTAQLLLGI